MFEATAPLYDLIYAAMGKDYAAESEAVHRLVQGRRPGARTLLDVACGTGGHLRHLRAHYEVVGADLVPAMLEEARGQLGDVELVEADMRTMDLGRRFDAVVCLFSSVGYLRDAAELDQAVGAMARHLSPGGVLVVDGWVRPDAWRDGSPPRVIVADDGGRSIVRVSRSERHGAVTQLEMHHLIATAEAIEHLVDHHEMRLFEPREYEAAFEAAGLPSEVVEGPMPGRDRYVGVAPA
ncbi:MAG: class I SAM-dependent methyltransferase [Acidimicrobiales bacterium]